MDLMPEALDGTKSGEDLRVENDAREAGDPDIVWAIGCKYSLQMTLTIELKVCSAVFLSPEYHGQGIVTDACKTLMKWGKGALGIRKILGIVFEGNEGSKRVMEKLGFEYRKTLRNHLEVRGVLRTLELYDIYM